MPMAQVLLSRSFVSIIGGKRKPYSYRKRLFHFVYYRCHRRPEKDIKIFFAGSSIYDTPGINCTALSQGTDEIPVVAFFNLQTVQKIFGRTFCITEGSFKNTGKTNRYWFHLLRFWMNLKNICVVSL